MTLKIIRVFKPIFNDLLYLNEFSEYFTDVKFVTVVVN